MKARNNKYSFPEIKRDGNFWLRFLCCVFQFLFHERKTFFYIRLNSEAKKPICTTHNIGTSNQEKSSKATGELSKELDTQLPCGVQRVLSNIDNTFFYESLRRLHKIINFFSDSTIIT